MTPEDIAAVAPSEIASVGRAEGSSCLVVYYNDGRPPTSVTELDPTTKFGAFWQAVQRRLNQMIVESN